MSQDTASKFASDAHNFIHRNERSYHGHQSLEYPLPNDDPEIARLLLQYNIFKACIDRRHCAPLKNPKRALDVGTAQANWLLDMGAAYPECRFTGLDITPLRDTVKLPGNCDFQLANVREGLPFPDNTFDLVHHSLMLWAWSAQHWPAYMREAVRVTKPGGWVEIMEVTDEIYEQNEQTRALFDCYEFIAGLSQAQSKVGTRVDKLMVEAGLQNVRTHVCRVPLGSWAGELGVQSWENYRLTAEALAPTVAEHGKMSLDKFHQLIKSVGEYVDQNHGYYYVYVFYGQKPE